MYCTLDDILLRTSTQLIVEMTQDDNKAVEINIPRINAAISDASALIDSKISQRYELPLNPIPQRLIRIAVDLTMYFIYALKFGTAIPEGINTSYRDAIKYCEDIRDGNENIEAIQLATYENAIVMDYAKFDSSFDIKELNKF